MTDTILDTELKVVPKGFEWGYTAGPLKVSNIMKINEKGEWAETTESTYGATPPRKSVEMSLRRQRPAEKGATSASRSAFRPSPTQPAPLETPTRCP